MIQGIITPIIPLMVIVSKIIAVIAAVLGGVVWIAFDGKSSKGTRKLLETRHGRFLFAIYMFILMIGFLLFSVDMFDAGTWKYPIKALFYNVLPMVFCGHQDFLWLYTALCIREMEV